MQLLQISTALLEIKGADTIFDAEQHKAINKLLLRNQTWLEQKIKEQSELAFNEMTARQALQNIYTQENENQHRGITEAEENQSRQAIIEHIEQESRIIEQKIFQQALIINAESDARNAPAALEISEIEKLKSIFQQGYLANQGRKITMAEEYRARELIIKTAEHSVRNVNEKSEIVEFQALQNQFILETDKQRKLAATRLQGNQFRQAQNEFLLSEDNAYVVFKAEENAERKELKINFIVATEAIFRPQHEAKVTSEILKLKAEEYSERKKIIKLAELKKEILSLEEKMQGLNKKLEDEVLKKQNEFAQKTQNEIKELKEEIATLAAQEKALEPRVERIEAQVVAVEERIDTLESRMNTLDSKVYDIEHSLNVINQSLGKIDQKIKDLVQLSRPEDQKEINELVEEKKKLNNRKEQIERFNQNPDLKDFYHALLSEITSAYVVAKVSAGGIKVKQSAEFNEAAEKAPGILTNLSEFIPTAAAIIAGIVEMVPVVGEAASKIIGAIVVVADTVANVKAEAALNRFACIADTIEEFDQIAVRIAINITLENKREICALHKARVPRNWRDRFESIITGGLAALITSFMKENGTLAKLMGRKAGHAVILHLQHKNNAEEYSQMRDQEINGIARRKPSAIAHKICAFFQPAPAPIPMSAPPIVPPAKVKASHCCATM